jgi:hypothetical protein
MGPNEKRVYLEAIRGQYRVAGRKTKKHLLDVFCDVCGYNRKYAIVLLNKPLRGARKAKRGRRPIYGEPRFLKVLHKIWKVSDYACSRRLKATIPLWLPHYERKHKAVDDETKKLLLSVSHATLDRILKPLRGRLGKGLSGTKPSTLFLNRIPIRTDSSDIDKPGFMEADTVAHCGTSIEGDFVWSLTMTDIHSGWTECRAVWNKAGLAVLQQVKEIERNLPFQLLEFDTDNGSEFLNKHFLEYFENRKQPVRFTRGRPYKKNDNAHVEQKNWTHPRRMLGYDRIENPELVAKINDLYANEWSLFHNYCSVSTKLTSKIKINSKYKKNYDTPKTPCQRLLDSDKIPNNIREMLTELQNTLNPFELKNTIEQKLKTIFNYIRVTPNVRRRV